MAQVGTTVVANGSGSINTTALTNAGSAGIGSYVWGSFKPGSSVTSQISLGGGTVNLWMGITGPPVFGSGPQIPATNVNGSTLGLIANYGIYLLPSYVSGSQLTTSIGWNNQTLTGLGLTPGTYKYTWGSGASADSFTLNIIPPSAYVMTVSQAGANVVANGAGAINTNALTNPGGATLNAQTFAGFPQGSEIAIGLGGSVAYWPGISGPAGFGTGGQIFASSSAGGTVGIAANKGLYLDPSYVSGTPISSSAVWNNMTIAGLGLTPGTYTYTWGSGADASSLTLDILGPTSAPVIGSVVNGASFLPGVESGSWVSITGSGLSNTDPGRTWTPAEIVNGSLPTSLDGTSVTINGKPAFVEYISPTFVNVQAPTDATVGPVEVIVTNNGQPSAPFTAQLQAVAPAIFQYAGNYAVITHTDYAVIGNPSVTAGTVAAKPGDVLILWATGFGPTNPVTPAGIESTGAPAVANAPIVKVGGVQASFIGGALTPGAAGLYQIAIQLPNNVPTGPVSVQAILNGVSSPAGILTYVAGP